MCHHRYRSFLAWSGFSLLLSWTFAVGCMGVVGVPPGADGVVVQQEPGSQPDASVVVAPDGRVVSPDTKPLPDAAKAPDQSAVTPDQPGLSDGMNPDSSNQCPPVTYDTLPAKVYYNDMQSFLTTYCVNCHGATSLTGDILVYHQSSRGRAPVDFWAHALKRIKDTAKPMPPSRIDPYTCDNIARFKNGVKLFEAWALNNFAEKPGGTTPTKVDPSVKSFPQSGSCQGKEPLPARLWRLTGRQLRYALLDVFGSAVQPPKHTMLFQHSDNFDNNASTSLVTDVDLVHMLQWLDGYSKGLVSKVSDIRSCVAATGTGCVKAIINKYGTGLWRRYLQAAELNALMATFTTLESKYNRATGMEGMLERMILSHQALYRSELGIAVSGQPGVRRLSHNEVASFLSFTIFQSVPDAALRTAASKKQLGTLAEVRAQVSRMLKLPNAKRGLFEFFYDWLHLDKLDDANHTKDTKLYPQYTSALQQSLLKETQMLIDDVVWKRLGSLSTLFTTNQTFANKETAKLYGMSVGSSQFQSLMTPTQERAGIMTTPAFLAAHAGSSSTGIVHRGLFVLIHLLCQQVGDPPAGATEAGNDKLKGKDQTKMTSREILEAKTSTGTCYNCHSQINPSGYAFELYDPIGRYRTTEKGGLSLDASGSMSLIDPQSPKFSDGVEMIRKLAQSQIFRQCFTLKMYDYFLGMRPKADQSCGVASMFDSLRQNQFQLSKSFEAILSMNNFFLRQEKQSTP